MSDMSNVGTPDNSDSQDTDWQKRYTDLQSEYTRTSQEAAELRQYREMVDALHSDDPELSAQAAEALGISFVGDETSTNEPPDQTAILEQRLERIENWLGSQNEQEALQKMQDEDSEFMDKALGGLETQLGRELTKPEVELMVSHALVNRTEDGNPGIQSAIELYQSLENNAQSRWQRTKRVSTPTQGQEGTETPPELENHQARVARMAQQWEINQRKT